jgi:SMI1 / KNR4 family (SUKH-1)
MNLPLDLATKYEELRRIIDPWARLGTRKYLNGTLRIGHVPHIAPEGYLHHLLPPISQENLETLQDKIGWDFPESLCELLKIHNGISLFDHVSVYGKRTSYKRSDIDAMMEQPYDMVLPNTLERPDNAPEELIFIGSLGDDRQLVGVWPDGSISLWDPEKESASRPLYGNVFDFLLRESIKAQSLFDDNGHRIDLGS